jgi:glycosyltransferase involved in cell wall biosynthesis
MKILYLYSEVMGYNVAVFEQLVLQYGATVDVVHWNNNKLTPYVAPDMTGVQYHERSRFNTKQLIEFSLKLQPDLVYISGWMDAGYLKAVAQLKAIDVPIVVGFDTQWTGSLRQRLGAQLLRWHYKSKYFSYALIPGPLQFAYATRIGFKQTEILYPLLSGNTSVFSTATQVLSFAKKRDYPKRFLYVGRFTESKGVDILLAAFQIYKSRYQGAWGLTLVGAGPLLAAINAAQLSDPDIHIEPFSDQLKLVEHAIAAGAFVLPSRYEPWGVVAHEFSSAGLPLILSEAVGARTQLLIDHLNGYTFYRDSAEDLAQKLARLSTLEPQQLCTMGLQSARLASSIDTKLAVASFVSVAKRLSV